MEKNIYLRIDNKHLESFEIAKKKVEEVMSKNMIKKRLTDQDVLKYCILKTAKDD